MSRLLRVLRLRLGRLIIRIDEDGDGRCRGRQLVQQLQPLALQHRAHDAHAGDVAAGPIETGDEPRPDRIRGAHEHNRDRAALLL